MIRSFCLGALAGFFFGSSRMGKELRGQLDGFLTELLNPQPNLQEDSPENSEMDDVYELRNKGSRGETSSRHKFGGHGNGNAKQKREAQAAGRGEGRPERAAQAVAESAEQRVKPKKQHDATAGEGELPMDKAVELADTLNAKPTAPETDELAPS